MSKPNPIKDAKKVRDGYRDLNDALGPQPKSGPTGPQSIKMRQIMARNEANWEADKARREKAKRDKEGKRIAAKLGTMAGVNPSIVRAYTK